MLALIAPVVLAQTMVTPPKVGERAPGFSVKSLEDKSVRLGALVRQGPVVLVVLRGYPGYQCPICTQQSTELFGKAGEFAKRKASVVMVYPGAAENLKKFAQDFVAGKDVPKPFQFTLDPDYRFTESYGLRWNAPNETAYPSTFVIGRDGRVAFAKVSRGHGDRANVTDVLTALDKLPK